MWKKLNPIDKLMTLASQEPPKQKRRLAEWGNEIVAHAKSACARLEPNEMVRAISEFGPFRDPRVVPRLYTEDARRLVWGTVALYVENKLKLSVRNLRNNK